LVAAPKWSEVVTASWIIKEGRKFAQDDWRVAMMLSLSLRRGSCCISKVHCHEACSTHCALILPSIPKLCPSLMIDCNGSYHH
jgi:hypothetical protein